MDETVKLAPFALQRRKGGFHALIRRHVGGEQDLDTQLFRERFHPLFHRLNEAEGELSALRCQLLRNGPGDRVLVGHAHDQDAFALHQLTGGVSGFVAHGPVLHC